MNQVWPLDGRFLFCSCAEVALGNSPNALGGKARDTRPPGEATMGALLLLALVLQSLRGCVAQAIYVEYDPLSENFSVIYKENAEYFPSEMYYYGNSTYDYDNSTMDYDNDTTMPDDWIHIQNSANSTGAFALWHNLLFLPLLCLLQLAGRI